jgi:hypothetical protein
MAKITKINSSRGVVKLSQDELIENDLMKWIRHESKGIHNRNFVDVQPIERHASKLYKEAYPELQVKIAEKCILNADGSVDVILRVAKEIPGGMYNTHPTKLVFTGKLPQSVIMDNNFNVDAIKNSKHNLDLADIDLLMEHVADFNYEDLSILDEYLDSDQCAVEFLAKNKYE